MSNPEITPQKQEEQVGLRPIDKKLLGNLYWSFHYSQSSEIIQELTLYYTARFYSEDDIEQMKNCYQWLGSSLKKLKIPKEHKDSEKLNIYPFDVFQMHMYEYIRIINFEKGGDLDDREGIFTERLKSLPQEPSNKLLFYIVENILEEDSSFVKKGREGRIKRDPHASQLREHMYMGEKAKTPEFEQMFEDIRNFFHDQGIDRDEVTAEDPISEGERVELRDSLEKLSSAWEERHPGEKFFPEETAA